MLVVTLAIPRPAGTQALACTGYDSQVWAQSVFETCPARYVAVDSDGNSLACEELPIGTAPAWWSTEIPEGAEPARLIGVSDGDTNRVLVDG